MTEKRTIIHYSEELSHTLSKDKNLELLLNNFADAGVYFRAERNESGNLVLVEVFRKSDEEIESSGKDDKEHKV